MCLHVHACWRCTRSKLSPPASLYLYMHMCVCLSIHPSVFVSEHLSVNRSDYPFIHPLLHICVYVLGGWECRHAECGSERTGMIHALMTASTHQDYLYQHISSAATHRHQTPCCYRNSERSLDQTNSSVTCKMDCVTHQNLLLVLSNIHTTAQTKPNIYCLHNAPQKPKWYQQNSSIK